MVFLILSVVLLLLAAHYVYLLGSAATGFVRGTRRSGNAGDVPSVSVIVPARNEEETIGECLDSILANDYPGGLLEVIVVDDGSSDRTAEIAGRRRHASPNVRVLRLGDLGLGGGHKKAALARGVAEARGDLVLTTDADCTVPPRWIRSMIAHFDPDVGMVTGPVLYRRRIVTLGRVQALEFLGLVALGGGLIGVGRPHLCNSANLAYRRRAYDDVGGYDGLDDVTTGDDDMLLHRVAFETSWKIRTCMERDAAVWTDPHPTLRGLMAQRTRWASAHARYRYARLRTTSILCYFFYAGLVAAFAAAFVHPGIVGVLGIAMGAKLGAEAALLVPAAIRFGRAALLPLLLPAQLAYVPYILVVGITGTLGRYTWKGRLVTR